MRFGLLLLTAATVAWPQFRSTVPLVVAPTTVKDARGLYVDRLQEPDLILYDNNVARPVQIDYSVFPISLVVVVETASSATAVLNKLGGSGILFTALMAGDGGETALLGFDDEVRELVPFTADSDPLKKQLRSLKPKGRGARVLDGLDTALEMLSKRKPGMRPVVLMISESRDRGSEAKLDAVVQKAQRVNASIHWLTFSKTWTRYTDRNRTTPSDEPEFNLLAPFLELAHLASPDVAKMFSSLTGASTANFLTRKALESAIHDIGEEIHRQYILSFTPAQNDGMFHRIRVEVRGRPELRVKTRDGYWAVQ